MAYKMASETLFFNVHPKSGSFGCHMSENQFSILMQQALTFDNRTRKSPDFECPIFGTRKLSHQKNLATTQQKKLKLYNTCFVRVQQPFAGSNFPLLRNFLPT